MALGTISVLIYSLLYQNVTVEAEKMATHICKSAVASFRLVHDWHLYVCGYIPNGKWPRFGFLFRHLDVVFLDNLIVCSEAVFSQMIH